MINFDECLSCKKTDVHLISVSDHPDFHDGMYCETCNPYEVDRQDQRKRDFVTFKKGWNAAKNLPKKYLSVEQAWEDLE